MIRVAIVEDEVHSVSTSRFREILHLRAREIRSIRHCGILLHG